MSCPKLLFGLSVPLADTSCVWMACTTHYLTGPCVMTEDKPISGHRCFWEPCIAKTPNYSSVLLAVCRTTVQNMGPQSPKLSQNHSTPVLLKRISARDISERNEKGRVARPQWMNRKLSNLKSLTAYDTITHVSEPQ